VAQYLLCPENDKAVARPGNDALCQEAEQASLRADGPDQSEHADIQLTAENRLLEDVASSDQRHVDRRLDIHLMIGRRPSAAFGNSTGDREMLEYTGAGNGMRLMMLVLHDDAQREYAHGPAQGLADTRVGAFTQALYDEAKQDGWTVISMKNDWKRIFSFQ
jgi:hypothetical protein